MLYTKTQLPQPSRRVRPRPWRRVSLAVLAVAAVAYFAWFRAANSAATPATPAAPAAGWRIDLFGAAGGRVDSSGGQKFGGAVLAGRTLLLPAGAEFSILAQPTGACGFFAENSAAGSWNGEGGILAPPGAGAEGWRQAGRAPAQPGLYQWTWHARHATPQAQPGLSAGGTEAEDAGACSTAAPQPGGGAFSEPVLNVLVLARAEMLAHGERTEVKVNGKSIGAYPDPARSSLRRVRECAHLYQPPALFAALTPRTSSLLLGPDLELGQLIAFKDYHGPDGRKVYTAQRHTDVLPPRADLIDKLAKLRERLRKNGVAVTRFRITSGFRTPDYNRSIGGAAFSRHCYGDAVDLCIDENNDRRMDDLNGDGRIDRKDGLVIAQACRELELEGAVALGGIGVYEWDGEDSVRSHVHIDCRGYIARWGQSGSGKARKSFTWWPKAEFSEEDSGE